MSQALPVLTQLPVLEGRRPDLRSPDGVNRPTFGKLLDRFSRRDVAKDTAKEPAREPATERRAVTAADSDPKPESLEDAPSAEAVAEANVARGAPEPTAITVVAPAIRPDAFEVPVVVAPPVEAPAVTPILQQAEPLMPSVEPSPIAPVAPSLPQPPIATTRPTTTEHAAAPTPMAVAPEAIAALVPQPAAEAIVAPAVAVDRGGAPVVPAPVAPAATAGASPGGKPVATKAQPTLVAVATDAALERTPLAWTTPAPAEPIFPERQIRLGGTPSATQAAELAEPLTAIGRDDRTANAKTPEHPIGALLTVDAARSAAAQYHKVAEAARTAAAGETSSPADELSIRLLHAVAEGKRTIQMHLHPAELGSIDVRMQWQGDRLTAQFQVDRLETLVLLQRDVPALERTLNQAGVNVDSGSLSFSLRQHTGNGQNSNNNGQALDPAATNGDFGEAADLPLGGEPLGQLIRDGLLSIRV